MKGATDILNFIFPSGMVSFQEAARFPAIQKKIDELVLLLSPELPASNSEVKSLSGFNDCKVLERPTSDGEERNFSGINALIVKLREEDKTWTEIVAAVADKFGYDISKGAAADRYRHEKERRAKRASIPPGALPELGPIVALKANNLPPIVITQREILRGEKEKVEPVKLQEIPPVDNLQTNYDMRIDRLSKTNSAAQIAEKLSQPGNVWTEDMVTARLKAIGAK